MPKLKSKVTTAPDHDFGLKAGNEYEVAGYPYHKNAGIVFVYDEVGEMLPYPESYFEAME